MSTKPGNFVKAKLPVGSGERNRRMGFGFGFLGARPGVWVVVADGVSNDEVDERTDAGPGTPEDYDDVWFGALEKRRPSKKNGGEKGLRDLPEVSVRKVELFD